MAINKEFIVNLKGKDFVTFPGLLDLAHQQDLRYVSTELVQIPDADNDHTAIVTAKVETSKGTFTGIGDANPVNVGNKMIAVHAIRMAETRAIARALRFATNIGMTALEEIGGDVVEAPAKEYTTTHDAEATQGQIDLINSLAKNAVFSDAEKKEIADRLASGLTKAKAAIFIDRIKGKIEEAKGD